jgi:ABC-type transport system involved in multi-copper enzyme maturation permease subunit
MKLRALAWITFASLLRNKLIVLICAVFLCVVLLMMSPLMAMKSMAGKHPSETATMVLSLVSVIMGMLTGFGSLLAAWAAADSVSGEMKSGTILAVMARPVRRWEFLLGKYLGVQILMLVYVLAMFGMSYLLAWIGDARIQTTPWVLIAYPMVRYAIYSALAILLVTMMHPVLAFGSVLTASVLASMVSSVARSSSFPEWLRKGLYVVLPSTNLLSESQFLSITQTTLKRMAWPDHLLALSYGLDYALVCFLLAVWSFQHRSQTRD